MPSYEQKRFEDSEKKNQLRLVASPDGAEGSVTINSGYETFCYAFRKRKERFVCHCKGRAIWVQCISGRSIRQWR